MLKVFLVEDEIVVREGIKKKINWEQSGLEFVGEASDGELAFPMIQALKPDILITDIKMPFVDGIELSKMVKKEFPNIKIIILSGYGEFSYAKEAISIGVTEYLLKPISAEKLLSAIHGVAEEIREESEQQSLLEQYQIEREERFLLEKQQFFYDLVSKEIPMPIMNEKAKYFNMNIVACHYNIVLFKIMNADNIMMEYSEKLNNLNEMIEGIINDIPNVELFHRNIEGDALLFMIDTKEEFDKLSTLIINKIIHLVEEQEWNYYFGIGKIVQRLRELPEAFHQANRALSTRFMGKNNQVIHYDQLEDMMIISEKEIDLKEVDKKKLNKLMLENFYKIGSLNETDHFIYDYFIGIGINNMKSFLFRQYIAMDFYLGTVSFLKGLSLTECEIEQTIGTINKMSNQLNNVENTGTYLTKILKKVIKVRDQIANKKYDDLLHNATTFIYKNYSNDEISLNLVASSVNISPSYFSAIFSQEMGMTFIEYLTEVRMNKAKELLVCTNMKTSEIGYDVGYKDSHYFSYLFRKTQNCSPKEFRMKRKG